jgi:hypothetical protein
MGCLSVSLRRIGGITAEASRIGGMTASAKRVGGIAAKARRIGGIIASARRVGGMTARLGLVCSTDLGEYILWGRDGIIFNVYGDKIYLTKKP